MNGTIECKLTPEGLKLLKESHGIGTLKGNKLTTQLWEFMNIFGGKLYIGGPHYIVDNTLCLFQDKTIEEIQAELKTKVNDVYVAERPEHTVKKPKDTSYLDKKPKDTSYLDKKPTPQVDFTYDPANIPDWMKQIDKK